MISDRRPQFVGNRPTQFDGQVRNAAPGIQNRAAIALRQRPGGAGVDAARATPAAVGRRAVRCQVKRRDQLAQEEPRPHRLVDEAGIPADPTQPGLARQRTFEKGRRVHTGFVLERPEFLGEARGQPHQCCAHDVVIVLPVSVARDLAARHAGVVQLADADNRPRRGQQQADVLAQRRAMVRKVAHLTRHAGVNPLAEQLPVGNHSRGRNTRQLEPALARQRPDKLVHFSR